MDEVPSTESRAVGTTHVGLSGWNYPAWRRRFYAGVPQRDWLEHCIRSFSGLEVNATFYRFLKPEVFASWRDLAPPGFTFALKGHRFITHGEKLANTGPLLERMRSTAQPLGDRLAVVLWQLPQSLARDLSRLAEFATLLDTWPVRHAFEFRHQSWFCEDTAAFLSARGYAVCQSEGAEWPMWSAVTTDLVYVRFAIPASGAPLCDLDQWAERARRWRDEGREVHLYFDGDPQGDAPYRALDLMRRVAEP